MEIVISKNGKRFGPYTEAQVNGYVKHGHFTASDLAWHKGIPKWAPLGDVVKLDPSVPPPIPFHQRAAYAGGFSPADIIAIAERQKAIIWLMLFEITAVITRVWFLVHPQFSVAGQVTSPFLILIPLAAIVSSILAPVLVYRLARALRLSSAWVYAFVSVIPFFNLFALLSVSSEANHALKRRRIRVGLMGANKYDLEKLKLP
jgi:hypothetical protein